MKILFVASNNKQRFAPFIIEQAEALRRAGCEVELLGVVGKGISGYLKALPSLRKKIKWYMPDVIHAHYGLCGLLAGLQRRIPVVTTYHGSDINVKSVLPFSKVAMLLSAYNIFVSKKTIAIAHPKHNWSLLPCGIDLTAMPLTDKVEARKRMGLSPDGKYVLFAGAFDNAVKNYPLARAAMDLIPDAELIELKGYSREQVTLLMCGVDALLTTSHTEGSPLVIKEAMACGCPIVSVDVGDVSEVVAGVDGCYVCTRDPECISEKLAAAMGHGRTNGRTRIAELGFDNQLVAKKLIDIYSSII